MNKFIAISLAALLSGCASVPQVITKEKLTIVTPDRSMYACPTVQNYPNPDTLTDIEVAKLLVELEKNNTECRRSIKAIQNFIDQAKTRTNS